MKRKQFVKTLGLGIASVYTGSILTGCKKSSVNEIDQPSHLGNVPDPTNYAELKNKQLVDGYTDKLSYYPNETVKLYVNASVVGKFKLPLNNCTGAPVDYLVSDFKSQNHGTNAYENGFQYTESSLYKISEGRKSGLFFWADKIPFVVKNPNKNGDIVVVLPSNTDNAYNSIGGKSSYTNPLSPTLSFQRPYSFQSFSKSFWPWIETQPYKIDYIVDSDLDDYNNFSYAKLLIIPGHSEYWTRTARENFDRFIESGKDAMVLSGNTMWWQIRYSDDGSKMICYKDINDPVTDSTLKTMLWTTKSLRYPIENSVGANFDFGGYGTQKGVGWDGYKILAQNSPLLKGTNLKNEDVIKLPTSEYDGTPVKYVSGSAHPKVNNDTLKFHRIELIGYNEGFRTVKTVGTFIVVQKKQTSGVIINTGSTDWCSPNGMGGEHGDIIKKITLNGIDNLLNKQNVFSS